MFINAESGKFASILNCTIGNSFVPTNELCFSLVQTFQNLLPYPACLVGVYPKRKSNNHFKMIACNPTYRGSNITPLDSRRVENFSVQCVMNQF